MKESKYLTKAKEQVKQVVFATKTQGPLCDVLYNLLIGLRRTHHAPIVGHIKWTVADGFHCTLFFELWLPDPGSYNHSHLCWKLEQGASGATLDEFVDDVLSVMRRVDANKANVEKGLAMLHVQNMKRIEAEELARGLTAVEEDRK